MSFAFKTLDEALWEMMATFYARSGIRPDPTPGSVLRTLFEAVGFQVEDLTFRFDQAVRKAIPQAVFEAFGFTPRSATRAQTLLRFTRGAPQPVPLAIPQGFRVARADGAEYETLEEAAIPAGATHVDVPAAAVEPGEAGNAPAGAIRYPRFPLPGLLGVENPVPAAGGQDEEPLEEQKRRFALYIAQVHRATRYALEAAALTAVGPNGERAREALVLDAVARPCLPPGVVEVWVDDGFGTATDGLLAAVGAAVDRMRAAGVYVRVHRVEPVPVDVRAQVRGSEAARGAVAGAVRRYLYGLRVGEKVSRENLITALTVSHPEVEEVDVLTPLDDVAVPFNRRAVPGVVEVS
ncbi:baseplate J/gp47 family protein [Thermus brockianus]